MEQTGAYVDELELYFSHYAYAESDSLLFPRAFRYNERELSNPICHFIDSYEGPQDLLHRTCERIIVRIVETHRMYFRAQGSRGCYHDTNLFHQTLYVAARIAARSNMPNSALVARLLAEIYRCDQTFRCVLLGAYYESDRYVGAFGLHSLYDSRREGLAAFKYFLHHTSMVHKVFYNDHVPKRLGDLGLQTPPSRHPAVYAIAAGSYSTFRLLVEYGANLRDPTTPSYTHSVADRIWTMRGTEELKKRFRALFLQEMPVEMQSLMQLARLAIRRQLNKAFQLPRGIEELPIPGVLKRYIHIDPED